jgi:integrase
MVTWIHADEAKAERAIGVPLDTDAALELQRWVGEHPERVFTFKGKPIAKAGGAAWKKAMVRSGIENFRWHDLRHTWASWHAQAGTPLHVLQELGGWSSAEMVRRYAHLAPGHLAEHASAIEERVSVAGNFKQESCRTFSGTPEKRQAP